MVIQGGSGNTLCSVFLPYHCLQLFLGTGLGLAEARAAGEASCSVYLLARGTATRRLRLICPTGGPERFGCEASYGSVRGSERTASSSLTSTPVPSQPSLHMSLEARGLVVQSCILSEPGSTSDE